MGISSSFLYPQFGQVIVEVRIKRTSIIFTIFYSWQADTAINNKEIRVALREAMNALEQELPDLAPFPFTPGLQNG